MRYYIATIVLAGSLTIASTSAIKSLTGYYDYQHGQAARSNAEALAFYLKAAAKGKALGAFNAALMLERGVAAVADAKDKTQIDKPRAFLLYSQAADARLPEAELNLALFYMNGQGLPQSEALGPRVERAEKLLTVAALSGDRDTGVLAVNELVGACLLLIDEKDDAKKNECLRVAQTVAGKAALLNKEDDDFDRKNTSVR